MNPVPSSVSADPDHDVSNPDSRTDPTDSEPVGRKPSAARKYIDAVLEQSFRHLFGPTATPEQPRQIGRAHV